MFTKPQPPKVCYTEIDATGNFLTSSPSSAASPSANNNNNNNSSTTSCCWDVVFPLIDPFFPLNRPDAEIVATTTSSNNARHHSDPYGELFNNSHNSSSSNNNSSGNEWDKITDILPKLPKWRHGKGGGSGSSHQFVGTDGASLSVDFVRWQGEGEVVDALLRLVLVNVEGVANYDAVKRQVDALQQQSSTSLVAIVLVAPSLLISSSGDDHLRSLPTSRQSTAKLSSNIKSRLSALISTNASRTGGLSGTSALKKMVDQLGGRQHTRMRNSLVFTNAPDFVHALRGMLFSVIDSIMASLLNEAAVAAEFTTFFRAKERFARLQLQLHLPTFALQTYAEVWSDLCVRDKAYTLPWLPLQEILNSVTSSSDEQLGSLFDVARSRVHALQNYFSALTHVFVCQIELFHKLQNSLSNTLPLFETYRKQVVAMATSADGEGLDPNCETIRLFDVLAKESIMVFLSLQPSARRIFPTVYCQQDDAASSSNPSFNRSTPSSPLMIPLKLTTDQTTTTTTTSISNTSATNLISLSVSPVRSSPMPRRKASSARQHSATMMVEMAEHEILGRLYLSLRNRIYSSESSFTPLRHPALPYLATAADAQRRCLELTLWANESLEAAGRVRECLILKIEVAVLQLGLALFKDAFNTAQNVLEHSDAMRWPFFVQKANRLLISAWEGMGEEVTAELATPKISRCGTFDDTVSSPASSFMNRKRHQANTNSNNGDDNSNNNNNNYDNYDNRSYLTYVSVLVQDLLSVRSSPQLAQSCALENNPTIRCVSLPMDTVGRAEVVGLCDTADGTFTTMVSAQHGHLLWGRLKISVAHRLCGNGDYMIDDGVVVGDNNSTAGLKVTSVRVVMRRNISTLQRHKSGNGLLFGLKNHSFDGTNSEASSALASDTCVTLHLDDADDEATSSTDNANPCVLSRDAPTIFRVCGAVRACGDLYVHRIECVLENKITLWCENTDESPPIVVHIPRPQPRVEIRLLKFPKHYVSDRPTCVEIELRMAEGVGKVLDAAATPSKRRTATHGLMPCLLPDVVSGEAATLVVLPVGVPLPQIEDFDAYDSSTSDGMDHVEAELLRWLDELDVNDDDDAENHNNDPAKSVTLCDTMLWSTAPTTAMKKTTSAKTTAPREFFSLMALRRRQFIIQKNYKKDDPKPSTFDDYPNSTLRFCIPVTASMCLEPQVLYFIYPRGVGYATVSKSFSIPFSAAFSATHIVTRRRGRTFVSFTVTTLKIAAEEQKYRPISHQLVCGSGWQVKNIDNRDHVRTVIPPLCRDGDAFHLTFEVQPDHADKQQQQQDGCGGCGGVPPNPNSVRLDIQYTTTIEETGVGEGNIHHHHHCNTWMSRAIPLPPSDPVDVWVYVSTPTTRTTRHLKPCTISAKLTGSYHYRDGSIITCHVRCDASSWVCVGFTSKKVVIIRTDSGGSDAWEEEIRFCVVPLQCGYLPTPTVVVTEGKRGQEEKEKQQQPLRVETALSDPTIFVKP
eukprot:PhM_4_TR14145/c0_g1_i2/m.104256